ncbi:MAG: hypothetical protein A2X49_04120 [Lentisphaerae bacterium GWF2_52_8]|nr:MAG: hypothetical protein A2X49_04120 [Lentisphaerae bacterium GWF2_52_8]
MDAAARWENFEVKPEVFGSLMYKRAVGEEPEMECARACCEVLKRFYRPGMAILDVGCCTGHYLRSLRQRLDAKLEYKGVDPTPEYIALAKKAYPREEGCFDLGNIYNLQFKDASFDIVMCSNVILNLPPPPTQAFAELLRVSSKYVLVRTLVSSSIHICQKYVEVEEDKIKPREMIAPDGSLRRFNYRNMYTKAYLEDIVTMLEPKAKVEIFRDTNWGSFDNEKALNDYDGATKTAGNFQHSEELIFDWHYIIISKPGAAEIAPAGKA